MWFPATLSRSARDHVSLNVYWCNRINTAALFAVIYPWLFLAVLPSGTSGSSSNVGSHSSQTVPPLLALGIIILALAPGVIAVLTFVRPIENRMASARACQEISQLLQPEETEEAGETLYPGLIADPLGRRRWELAEIVQHLADAARRLDAQQPRGLPPHPVSTLLRAVSKSIRRFLGNQRSLRGPMPGDLTEMLETTLAVLGISQDQDVYDRLAKQADAFDEHGEPTVELTGKPPGRLATFASRIADSVPKIALVITSIAAVAVIITALILDALHRMNVTQLLSYLK